MLRRFSVHQLIRAAAVAALLVLTQPSGARADEEREPSQRLEIHGYGEVHYNSHRLGAMSDLAPAEADVHRMVLGWEYEFTPAIRLEAEVDYEHAAGEIELEEAVLEYDLGPSVSLRMGSLLMPVGPLNEFHEPPNYHSVERPYVEGYVIPTSWQEIGVGVAGRTSGGALGYRVYVVSGLDAAGFSTLEGIREGRQHGSEAAAEDLAVTGRLEYATRHGLSLGGSLYYGKAAQGDPALGDAAVGIVEADVRYRRGAIDLRGVAAAIAVDDADLVSAEVGETVGSAITGAYGEAAFDLLHHRAASAEGRSLWVFARVETFDTTADTEGGTPAVPVPRVPDARRTVATGGVAYHPIQPIAFKADLEHWKDGADQKLTRFNLGAAFQF